MDTKRSRDSALRGVLVSFSLLFWLFTADLIEHSAVRYVSGAENETDRVRIQLVNKVEPLRRDEMS